MLILFHAAVHALFGSVFAHAAPRPLARSQDTSVWRLSAALYVDLLTAAPLVAYQARLWPAYAFGYAVDPLLSPWVERFAPLFAFGALLGMPLSLSLGFWLCTAAKDAGRRALSIVPIALAAGGAAALFGWHYEEFTVVGDFPTYWRGGGTAALTHLHVQLVLGAYALGAIGLVVLRSRSRA